MFTTLFLLGLISCTGLSETSEEEFESTLRAWDDLHLNGVTLSLQSLELVHRRSAVEEWVLWSVIVTGDGSAWVTEKHSPEYNIEYTPPSLGNNARRIFHDSEGNLQWSEPVYFCLYSDSSLKCSLSLNLFRKIAPDNTVVFEMQRDPVLVSDAVEFPRPPIRVAHYLLGTGRGFSRLIDRVTDVTQVNDAIFDASCDGRYGGRSGRWNLRVDADSAYLVRLATFTPTNRSNYSFRIETDQQVSTDEYLVSKHATVWYRGKKVTAHLTYLSFQDEMDIQRTATLRQQLTDPELPVLTFDFATPDGRPTIESREE